MGRQVLNTLDVDLDAAVIFFQRGVGLDLLVDRKDGVAVFRGAVGFAVVKGGTAATVEVEGPAHAPGAKGF